MSSVVYDCLDCGEFWTKSPSYTCPKCASKNVGLNNDEDKELIAQDEVWTDRDCEEEELNNT